MWQLLSPKIKGFAWVFSTAFVAAILMFIRWDSVWPNECFIVRVVFVTVSAVGIVAGVGAFLGKQRWAWSVPHQLGITKSLYPDINGHWKGETTSFVGRDSSESLHTPVCVEIRQTWSEISLELTGPVTQVSETLFAIPEKNRTPCLWVIWRSHTSGNSCRDSDEYYGTERLQIGQGDDIITGRYWTNRAARQNSQTAGEIVLYRHDNDK